MFLALQPVESTASVKSTLYLLSDIGSVPDEPIFALRWLPFLAPARPLPKPLWSANHIPDVLGPDDPLPLEQLLLSHGESLAERVLRQLAIAENREEQVDFQQDIRQAYICVALAAQGNPIPFVESSYRCYGIHPDKLYPAILARRKALLGPEYAAMAGERALPQSVTLPGSPKKLPHSETSDKERAA